MHVMVAADRYLVAESRFMGTMWSASEIGRMRHHKKTGHKLYFKSIHGFEFTYVKNMVNVVKR